MKLSKFRVLFLKFRLKYFARFAGKYDFNEILQSDGIDVGKGTIFYNPNSIQIDRERPWMLQIGEYCKITSGTIILTHDYSRSVLRRKYGEIIGEAGKTVIGNNVFIGMNSIILMGTHIGDNVIIGAGSVVSGDIPDNCVIAGNPCRVIRSLDEHYKIRKKKCINEAKEYYLSFEKKYGRRPKVNEMGPFFPLFIKHSIEAIKEEEINLVFNGDEVSEVLEEFLKSSPEFNSFNSFVDSIEQNKI